MYELTFYYGNPSFEESKIFKKMIEVLRASGMTEDTAYECATSVFFAKEEAEEYRKKAADEKARINSIAQEKLPWMPAGYMYYTGNMYEGIVIADKYGNQFTYVPYLDIYVSRYEISKGNNGYPASVPDRRAWVNVSYKEAYNAAKSFDPSANSNLLTAGICKRIMRAITQKTQIDNHIILRCLTGIEFRTGASPQSMIYNIDCLVGNHYCMLLSEKHSKKVPVYGTSYKTGNENILSILANGVDYMAVPSKEIGFRICLRRNS